MLKFMNLAQGSSPPDEKIKQFLDTMCTGELTEAGIKVSRFDSLRKGEVPTAVIGTLNSWSFERAWCYWIARGAGIPPDQAKKFHDEYGFRLGVRVDGHCGSPDPIEWYHGFAVGYYHIDTQAGLNAFAKLLGEIYIPDKKPAGEEHEQPVSATQTG